MLLGRRDTRYGLAITALARLRLPLLLLFAQLPLILNPGYLSLDELQWWDRASVPAFTDLPWVSWTDLHAFQYRPLTFNLWLILARAVAAHAVAMHAAFVLLGTINALLLAACLRALPVRPAVAAAAALVFVLSPYAAYTHGWTGTLADLLVAAFGLLGARLLLTGATNPAASRRNALMLALLAALALLAKESAVVLPLLWLVPALMRDGPRAAIARIAPAGAVVLAYLAARMPALWSIGPAHADYAWRLANVPARLAEYAVFPWLPPLFEVGPSLHKGALRLVLAALFGAAVPFALLRAGWRYAGVWVFMVGAALAPVLVLPRSFDQYAYLAAVAGIGVAGLAWQHCTRGARWLLLASAAVASVHGLQIELRMREVGAIERRFHETLAAELEHSAAPVRIVPARAVDRWMLERWTVFVPRYRGVPLAARLAPAGADAMELVMRPDGTVVPSRATQN